jgi:DNA-binding transcriptional ArsR family regulator
MADSGKGRRKRRTDRGKPKKPGRKRKPPKGRPQRDKPRANGRLILAANHTLRRRLLRILHGSKKPLSPTKLSEATGVPVTNVSYHMNVLRRCGAVEVVQETQVRGAVEHFYASKVDDNELVEAMLGKTEAEDEGRA